MRFGVSEAEARLWLGEANDEDETYTIWSCNLEAFSFFNDLTGCWVRPPMGGNPERIDRGEMVATANMLNIPRRQRPVLFRQMQLMEAAAKEVFSS